LTTGEHYSILLPRNGEHYRGGERIKKGRLAGIKKMPLRNFE
jgi:hypothetical protein